MGDDTKRTRANIFLKLRDHGYTRLVPIIPPDAPVSERSSLYKRIGTPQDGRGKTPGIKGFDGKWRGFDWIAHEPDASDFERWHAMGAGVGIRTGQRLMAIDADTTDPDLADAIQAIVERYAGPDVPIRIGRAPKALYLVRTTEDLPYQRIEFGPASGAHRQYRVELLTEGRQFVAAGVHPATGKPYHWRRPIMQAANLPELTPADVAAMLEDMRQHLPDCGPVLKEGAGEAINQAALKGDPEAIRQAVAAIPNTTELFPSRESYRDMLYAIKAALPDDPDLAWQIAWDWCARWQDPEGRQNDAAVVRADWDRMKPPYRRGASWIYELAASCSNNAFTEALVWFEDLGEDDDNPFAEPPADTMADTFPLLTLADIKARPPLQWLVARHIPKESVGFLYAAPGAGKTFLALDLALHIAAGDPTWHGDRLAVPEKGAKVLYIALEGAYGLRQRIAAWERKHPLAEHHVRNFHALDVPLSLMSAEDVGRLVRTVRKAGDDWALVIVDTVSRAMPGADENLQKDMTLFVRACDAIRQAIHGAVIGIHHAGKSGDMRGSTVLRGAGDFVFRLERKQGATVGQLVCEKMKDGPDGWKDHYVFEVVSTGETAEDGSEVSALVPSRVDFGAIGDSGAGGPGGGGAGRAGSRGSGGSGGSGLAGAVLRAMRGAWDAGEPWAKGPKAKERWALRRMAADFGMPADHAEQLLALWSDLGIIRYSVRDAASKQMGYEVVLDPGEEAAAGIFD